MGEAVGPITQPDLLAAAYREVCETYRAIDDFRMKLLGLLPIVSVAGLFALENTGLVRSGSKGDDVVAYLSVFAALFTLALFVYELRGILICTDLIRRGEALEQAMGITGQFRVCGEARISDQHSGRWQVVVARHLNAKLAASAIYSLVCASWLFVALGYGFGIKNHPLCIVSAAAVGLFLAAGSYRMMWLLVHPEETPSEPAAVAKAET